MRSKPQLVGRILMTLAIASYAVGGLWFLIVWLSHWKMCTRTSA